MSYKVIKFFTDLEDKSYPYEVNAPYPREGQEADSERIAKLLSSENKQGRPLIIEVPDEPEETENPAVLQTSAELEQETEEAKKTVKKKNTKKVE